MKFLLFIILSSVSLMQGMEKVTLEKTEHVKAALEKTKQEKAFLTYRLQNTVLTIDQIKKGELAGHPTLKEAVAAYDRLNERLKRITTIERCITNSPTSPDKIAAFFAVYKEDNEKQLKTHSTEPVRTPSPKKKSPSFEEFLKKQEATNRSVSAPADLVAEKNSISEEGSNASLTSLETLFT